MVDQVYYDAQVGVLGAMLLEPRLIGPVMEQIRAEDFSGGRFRAIFQAMTGLFLEGRPVDPVTVKERLTGLEQVAKTLVDIMELTPTASNVWTYVDLLREQSTVLALRDLGQQLSQIWRTEDAQALADKINGVFSARPGAERLSARQVVEDFMERHGEGRHPDYLTWSLPKLDRNMYIERGDMVILGGYPSAGKTALALRFAWHMARDRRVGFYSLETKPSKLGDRSVSALIGVDMAAIKRSAVTNRDWEKLASRAEEISQRGLDLIAAGGMTVQDIRADALAHRYEVIFLDYLQLVEAPSRFNRTETVTSISIGLHQLAQGCGITVVALSQLRRAETTKNGQEIAPSMSSLRESGQQEQDADAVLLLYREKPDDSDSGRVLFIAKNKEGTIGKVYLDFDGSTQTFTQSDRTRETAAALAREGWSAQRANHNKAAARQQLLWDDLTEQWDRECPFEEEKTT